MPGNESGAAVTIRTVARRLSSGHLRARTLRPATALLFSCLLASGSASSVSANTTERFGPNTYDYSFVGFNCAGFDILIEGTGTDRVTVFFDGADEISKIVYYGRFPRDVLTNTVTGRAITVRGEYQTIIEKVPGDPAFSKTFVGFRYMVNGDRSGATIREVGRISFADVEQTLILFQAGKHDLALDEALWGTFCEALE